MNTSHQTRGETRRKPKKLMSPRTMRSILSHSVVGMMCFYVGIMLGMGKRMSMGVKEAIGPANLRKDQDRLIHALNENRSVPLSDIDIVDSKLKHDHGRGMEQQTIVRKRPFPNSSKNIFVDFATVPRDAFNEMIDVGVPLDDTTTGAQDVLVLYTSANGMPTGLGWKHDKIGIDANKALENCHEVKIILQETTKKSHNQCIAIVPQWQSYTIHKWMRMPPKDSPKNVTKVSLQYPLQSVPRVRQPDDGGYYTGVPMEKRITESNELLVEYYRNRARVLVGLKHFLKHDVMKNAKDPSLKTLVVLTCNKGQAELFRNFVCNARAKNLDLSHVVLFATDEYTANLARELGIRVWYDAGIFGSIPEDSAKQYGDRTFSKMMMAKVYCMNLAMSSGYNVLFQDVDIVWHRNPLPYLVSEEFQEWDMVFQDDGSRTWRYAPFSPNSGFYFVRNTPMTKYFFETFLRMGDMIQLAKSHQHILNDLLIDFSSSKGLRVKVVRKGQDNVFPGGVEFHNKEKFMKEMLEGSRKPYIFHMSWTNNKENKQKYFEQLGEWYISDDGRCVSQPNIKCHYRDKPSKIPCLESPSIDGKKASFW